MTFRIFLYWMGGATLIAWFTWGGVLFFINPLKTEIIGFFLFYATFALALAGTLTITGTLLRAWKQKDVLLSRHVIRSLRHSVLFTLLILVALLLLSLRLWTWWLMVLLILFVSFVEFLFLSLKQTRPVEAEKDEQ
ncbi:TPA: hypothetical protein DEP34_02360 [Candidatus Uhrbacteria bacterium]|uniref:Uncharacterized protein n=2 Tax=Candidatus Uhriibacteriota TaxID=1752732 RepID=A0A0G1Q7W8_9BACT|nr:MAG: hypothetical protein UX45_C0008G0022 [Candidatus Uhrbacteria bacterium GW2011_GWF2_46_218]KKU41126.1 MAG: hypothetical protein UX57_C0006G0036 [Candidatus Uhrbacteria bacterium GW2011_GWE2_46_68]HBK34307.1 hypothetical protein [Candidatus Uhrbacteria bacterium]HCB19206.1 hypothetical protein [Candidatus Uhrbacteria bacterium]